MRMGSKDLYLCLIPNPLDRVPSVTQDDVSELEETTPSRSWSLLQPLSGTCLYVGPFSVRQERALAYLRLYPKHRQGWFTYSYCHNDQIRQFKEAAQAPDPIGISSFLLILQDCAYFCTACFPVEILQC